MDPEIYKLNMRADWYLRRWLMVNLEKGMTEFKPVV